MCFLVTVLLMDLICPIVEERATNIFAQKTRAGLAGLGESRVRENSSVSPNLFSHRRLLLLRDFHLYAGHGVLGRLDFDAGLFGVDLGEFRPEK